MLMSDFDRIPWSVSTSSTVTSNAITVSLTGVAGKRVYIKFIRANATFTSGSYTIDVYKTDNSGTLLYQQATVGATTVDATVTDFIPYGTGGAVALSPAPGDTVAVYITKTTTNSILASGLLQVIYKIV